jgi:hypothetical protein
MADIISSVPFEIFLTREILNGILIVVIISFAFFLFTKRKGKGEEGAQPSIFLGYFFFLLSYAITRLFFVLSDIEIYYHGETALSEVYVGIAYAGGILGALWLFYSIERYLIKTRYVFTVIGIVIFALSIISITQIIPTTIPQTIIFIALPIFFALIFIMYLYVVIKTTGGARRRSTGILIGILFFMIGFLFGSSLFGNILDPIGLYTFRILIEPIILMVGGAIFTLSQR